MKQMRWKAENVDFQIMMQVFPPSTSPYRITETVYTCNGPRTRLTDHCAGSLQEALDVLNSLTGNPEVKLCT